MSYSLLYLLGGLPVGTDPRTMPVYNPVTLVSVSPGQGAEGDELTLTGSGFMGLTVADVTPDSGWAQGGDVVTITGSGFYDPPAPEAFEVGTWPTRQGAVDRLSGIIRAYSASVPGSGVTGYLSTVLADLNAGSTSRCALGPWLYCVVHDFNASAAGQSLSRGSARLSVAA